MSATVKYNNSTITTIANQQTKTLTTKGKWLTDNIIIQDTTAGSTTTLQSKTNITPTESSQTITADSGYDGLSSVQINAISSLYVGSGIARRSSTDLTASGATVTVPTGYYASQASKAVDNASLTFAALSINEPSVARTDGKLTLLSRTVDIKTTVGSISGYIQVSNSSLTTIGTIPTVYAYSNIPYYISDDNPITISTNTVTIPSGYYPYPFTKSIDIGTVTAPSSISGTSATVSTGTNTLTLTKTVSVTPNVTAVGYISAGTAGNASVSLTASVTTKAAATITPGTSNQTIAAGTYLTGAQTISGDANLVASNIVSGVSIFGVTGSYAIRTYRTGTTAPASALGNNGDIYLQTS